jgi:opacity protein-like surface antigen
MRILIASFACLALASVTATAADMMVKAPVYKVPAPPPFTWTGFYVGGNLGGAWADNDSTYVGVAVGYSIAPHTVSLPSASVVGGGQIGGNWQTGMFVLGGEADIDGRYLNASANGVLTQSRRAGYAEGGLDRNGPRPGWACRGQGTILRNRRPGLRQHRARLHEDLPSHRSDRWNE